MPWPGSPAQACVVPPTRDSPDPGGWLSFQHPDIQLLLSLGLAKHREWKQDQAQLNDGAWMEGPCAWPIVQLIFVAVFDPDLLSPQVDIHIMTQPPSGEWVYFDTEISNSSGRISYVIPENRRLGIGVYPVKMVVR